MGNYEVGTCSTPANDPEKSSEIKSLSQKIEIQLQAIKLQPRIHCDSALHPDPFPKGEVELIRAFYRLLAQANLAGRLLG